VGTIIPTMLAAGDAVPIWIIDAEGNTYNFSSPQIATNEPNSAAIQSTGMEDRNGNYLSGTDTAGRTITLQLAPGASTGTISYTVYGIQYKVTTIQTPVNYTPTRQQTLTQDTAYCAIGTSWPANDATINVISTIELPNNQFYTFHYDQTWRARPFLYQL
jgi:hypothetical protein